MPKAKPRFKPYNLDQHAMVVINYQDQLQPGTFEHAVHCLVHNIEKLANYGQLAE